MSKNIMTYRMLTTLIQACNRHIRSLGEVRIESTLPVARDIAHGTKESRQGQQAPIREQFTTHATDYRGVRKNQVLGI